VSLNQSEHRNFVDDIPDFFVKKCKKRGNVRSVVSIWSHVMHHGNDEKQIKPIEFHVRTRNASGVRHDFCAIIDCAHIDVVLNDSSIRGWPNKANFSGSHRTEGQTQQLVLISVLELIQNEKQWREFFVPSIVRLTPLNDCLNWRAQGLNPSLPISENLGGLADGEGQTVSSGGRLFSVGFIDSDGINKMLQSRPQVVNRIADHQSPAQERRRSPDVSYKAMPGEFCITLARNHVGITISPCPDFTLDGLSMFVCPSEFGERTF
jgi:hypothetical protein